MDYLSKIDSFKALAKGWDSYNADPPSEAAMRTARILIGEGLRPDRLCPSVVGGIGLTFKAKDPQGTRDYTYVEIYNNNTVYRMDVVGEDIKVVQINGMGDLSDLLEMAKS